MCLVGLGLLFSTATANADEYITDSNFDNLQVGSAPDNDEDAGAWHIEHTPGHPDAVEHDPHQFSIVPTSSFVPDASGNSLRIDFPSTLSNQAWVRNFFDAPILEKENEIVRASFDVFVPDSGNSLRGGLGLVIGEHNDRQGRGPQLVWNSAGSIEIYSGDGGPNKQISEVVSETPLDKWQHVQLDIDLTADTYDLFWSADGAPLDLVSSNAEFRATKRDALGVIGIAMWNDIASRPVGEAFLDNFKIEVLEKTLGDSNFDGQVDTVDFRALAENFGANPASWGQGDFDGNGVVGLSDVALLSEIISDSDKAELGGFFEAPETAALTVGQTYSQDFNSMAMDGASGSQLPTAWFVTGSQGAVRKNETGVDFPTSVRGVDKVASSVALNAGATEGDAAADRSLALYKPYGGQEDPVAIQLLTETEGTAGAVKLAFSVEAWDRGRGTTENRDGGEAKFNLSIEIDSGEETDFSSITGGDFTELLNLGTVTTGADLPRPNGFLDGNDPEHRVSFASEVLQADIPAGSRLRFRWETTEEADASDSWVFGIDDVSITLVAAGDTNLDGEVNFLDFLALAENFGEAGGWEQGDFDGDGQVAFLDFLALAENFGMTRVPAAAAAVPEPTAGLMAAFGILGLIGFRKRR